MTYCNLKQSLRCTSRESNAGDLFWIATESANIFLRPLESMLDIPKGYIRCAALVQQSWTVGDASKSKSIVIGNIDKIRTQIEKTLWSVLRFAAAGKTTTITPHHDRNFLALGVRWCPNIHVETIFSGTAVHVGIG